MEKKYISNSKDTVRMFKSDFLESLSKIHYSVPIYLYFPVIVFCMIKSFLVGVNPLAFFLLFGVGLVVWTFVEYIMHRYVFHFVPKSKMGLRLHFIIHGVHHDYPNDARRLVLPPAVSVPLAIGFYYLFRLILGPEYLWSFFGAFLLGYLVYDIGHYAMHHYNFKNRIFKKIKDHHMLHHYKDQDKGYGVSSPLWDKIFHSK